MALLDDVPVQFGMHVVFLLIFPVIIALATGASHLPQLLESPGTSADIDEDGDHGILGLDINQLEDEEWLLAAGRNLQNTGCYDWEWEWEWEGTEYEYNYNYVPVPCEGATTTASDYSYSPSVSESQSGFAVEGGGRPSSDGDGDSGLAGGVIAAIVLGSLLCCCLPCVVGGVFLFCRSKRKKQGKAVSQAPAQPGQAVRPGAAVCDA